MNQLEFDRLTQQSLTTIQSKVLADSVNPDGCRLTTMEWTYPRFIHSECLTHRKLSKSSASSRAIPLAKMIERVSINPVFPIHWGKNQKGMAAEQELDNQQKLYAAGNWLLARDNAVNQVKELESIGIHKQLGNRLLEPWMWITVIVSATNFENLFALRCHPAAEPHFQNLAYKIRDSLDGSKPLLKQWGEWHLPLFGFDGDELLMKEDKPKVSAGRCARISYLTHEGKRSPIEDIRLYNQLVGSVPLHASPTEHPAQAVNPDKHDRWLFKDWGNFDAGWLQLRKMLPGENVTERIREDSLKQ